MKCIAFICFNEIFADNWHFSRYAIRNEMPLLKTIRTNNRIEQTNLSFNWWNNIHTLLQYLYKIIYMNKVYDILYIWWCVPYQRISTRANWLLSFIHSWSWWSWWWWCVCTFCLCLTIYVINIDNMSMLIENPLRNQQIQAQILFWLLQNCQKQSGFLGKIFY